MRDFHRLVVVFERAGPGVGRAERTAGNHDYVDVTDLSNRVLDELGMRGNIQGLEMDARDGQAGVR